MPPKKKTTEDNEEGLDAIADATNRILSGSDNSPKSERSSAQSQNSTKAEKRDREKEREVTGQGSSSNTSNGTEKDRLPGPYVAEELSYTLQEVQLKLRKMTGEKISQSLIIECALEICLQDFNSREGDSGLAKLVERKYNQDR